VIQSSRKCFFEASETFNLRDTQLGNLHVYKY